MYRGGHSRSDRNPPRCPCPPRGRHHERVGQFSVVPTSLLSPLPERTLVVLAAGSRAPPTPRLCLSGGSSAASFFVTLRESKCRKGSKMLGRRGGGFFVIRRLLASFGAVRRLSASAPKSAHPWGFLVPRRRSRAPFCRPARVEVDLEALKCRRDALEHIKLITGTSRYQCCFAFRRLSAPFGVGSQVRSSMGFFWCSGVVPERRRPSREPHDTSAVSPFGILFLTTLTERARPRGSEMQARRPRAKKVDDSYERAAFRGFEMQARRPRANKINDSYERAAPQSFKMQARRPRANKIDDSYERAAPQGCEMQAKRLWAHETNDRYRRAALRGFDMQASRLWA